MYPSPHKPKYTITGGTAPHELILTWTNTLTDTTANATGHVNKRPVYVRVRVRHTYDKGTYYQFYYEIKSYYDGEWQQLKTAAEWLDYQLMHDTQAQQAYLQKYIVVGHNLNYSEMCITNVLRVCKQMHERFVGLMSLELFGMKCRDDEDDTEVIH